jgi:hypothetical protein
MYFLQFIPNVSVHWRWPEVYCNRYGWFKVLLISGRSNTRLVTLWFTLLQPLDLVGVKADECCTEASNFSDILQSLYMLFSLSCLTLVIVYSIMSENDMKYLLRTEVSWCACVEDCNAAAGNCIHFFLTSLEWFYRQSRKWWMKRTVRCFMKKIMNFGTAFKSLIWNTIFF